VTKIFTICSYYWTNSVFVNTFYYLSAVRGLSYALLGGEEVHHIFWKIQFNENLRSSVPPPIVERSELGVSPSRGTDFPRKNRFLANYEGLSVRVTVDLLTFCLVTIFNVESQETELELEQSKKNRHPCIYERTWKIHTEKIE